jgi:hypothetical protein
MPAGSSRAEESGLACPEGRACVLDPACADGGADCAGTSAPGAREAAPCLIGGSSGEICSDQPRASPCRWRPEFVCYRTATCEPQAGGACGWTMTP